MTGIAPAGHVFGRADVFRSYAVFVQLPGDPAPVRVRGDEDVARWQCQVHGRHGEPTCPHELAADALAASTWPDHAPVPPTTRGTPR